MVRKFFHTRAFDGIFFVLLLAMSLVLMMRIKYSEPASKLRITSDKAGYYVYLPATFIYHWDLDKFPKYLANDDLGFSFNTPKQKVVTKFTCGTAILWSPFWFGIHAFAVQHLQPDGFSGIYQWGMLIPGVFYLVLGLYFLFLFLQNYYPKGLSLITVLLLFAGTNLYCYGLDEGMMAHSGSFFLFSLFLFLLKKFLGQNEKSLLLLTGILLVIALITLVRPTGFLLFSCFFFIDISTFSQFRQRLQIFFRPVHLLLFIGAFFVVFLPQFIYWRYLTGHFITWSYGGETFKNIGHPQLLPAWFSPLNGFFLYTPLALGFIAGIVLMIRKKKANGLFIGILFLFASYIFASWECWYFGGSFGYRSLVEFYAILAIPFAWFLGSIQRMQNPYIRSIMVVFLCVSVWYNQKLTAVQHWNNSAVWAWDDYFQYLDKAGLYSFPYTSYTFREDCENVPVMKPYSVTGCFHSPTRGGLVSRETEDYPLFQRQLANILNRPVKKINASVWIKRGNESKTGLTFYLTLDDWKKVIYVTRQIEIDPFLRQANQWTKVAADFNIPEWVNQGVTCTVGLRNPLKKGPECFDDLKLRFE